MKGDELKQEDGWQVWSRFVLNELERLNANFADLDGKTDVLSITLVKEIGKLREEIVREMGKVREYGARETGKVREEITALKVKASIWGGLGGLVPVAIALSVWAISHLLGGPPTPVGTP